MEQLPEPDTVAFGTGDGLPSSHTRYLARTGDTVMVASWQGDLGQLRRTPHRWEASAREGLKSRSRMCADGEGRLWSHDDQGVVAFRGDEVWRWPLDDHDGAGECAAADDGSVWLSGRAGIVHSSELVPDAPARVRPGPPGAHPRLNVVVEHGGRLFVTRGALVCSAPLGREPLDFGCETLEGIGHATAAARLRDGSLWLSTVFGGVFTHREGGWVRLPGSVPLAPSRIDGIAASPSGGAWILGHRAPIRAQPTAGGTDWEVVERLGSAQGLPSLGGTDLLEDDDGTLWLTTGSGVVHIPSAVRARTTPVATHGRLEVDGVFLDVPAGRDGLTYAVPHRPGDVQVQFTSLSYRDPAQIEYRVRRGAEGPWSPLGESARLRLVELSPGPHEFVFGVSTNGVDWVSSPPIRFVVAHPPWADPRPWLFLLAAGLCAVAGLYFGRGLVPARKLAALRERAGEPS